METVGVKAVVQGLSQFVGDIGKLNSALESIKPSGNIVSRTLEGVSNWFGNLGQSMLRVAEIALGVLVRDAFLAIVNGLKEIIADTIEAGNQFQILQLRLNQLNLNVVTQGATSFGNAMQYASEMTAEQLRWVQRLAATTPFDFQDIANVYTLARSYDFADETAQGLTEDIANFAAGMGLGNQEIERIIVNFGQMVQQGKVTQRELNDLARGAFVPVNDVLERMQENLGMTDREFEKFRYTGEGVNAFMQAFSNIVEERFGGAAEQMARTFKGATDNAKDFIKSIFGFGIVTPILDKIGGKIADVVAQLTTPERFDAMTEAAGRVGDALGRIVERVLNLTGGAEGIADGLVNGLTRVADWIEEHETDIVWFFLNLKNKIIDVVSALQEGDLAGALAVLGVDPEIIAKIEEFRDTFTGMLDTIKGWVEENGPLIEEFFTSLGEIFSSVFGGQFEGMGGGGGGSLEGFLELVKDFMTYVTENKDAIAYWVAVLFDLWAVLQIVLFVIAAIIGPFLLFLGAVLGIANALSGFISILALVLSPLTVILIIIGFLAAAFILLIAIIWMLVTNWTTVTEELKRQWEVYVQGVTDLWLNFIDNLIALWDGLVQSLTDIALTLWDSLKEIVAGIQGSFTDVDWNGIGTDLIQGIIDGVGQAGKRLLATLQELAGDAAEVFSNVLGIESPSTVFRGFGVNLMKGLAEGIEQAEGLVANAMQGAAATAMMPMVEMGGAVSTQNNYTNNWNLTVNSSASQESVVTDYNMMQSMAGA